MNQNKKFNVLMVVAVALVAVMSIGYAAFSSALELEAAGEITGKWAVAFDAESLKSSGSATDKTEPKITSTLAQFDVNFAKPGESRTYELKVKNTGTIAAYLSSVTLIAGENNSEEITFAYEIKNADGQVISSSASPEAVDTTYDDLAATSGEHTVTVTITYVSSDTQQSTDSEEFKKTATYALNLTYLQSNS